jgi:hypothetical protein
MDPEDPSHSFSKRFGYSSPIPKITVREDAPEELRVYVLSVVQERLNLAPSWLRRVICGVLFKRPDPSNWSEYPNIWGEVQNYMYEADWFKVYDIIEAIHNSLWLNEPPSAEKFEALINEGFLQLGIGWKLEDGKIETRGEEAFESVVKESSEKLSEKALNTARTELKEAVLALSRRPEPNVRGAIHHAMAALECVAREVTGDRSKTLGDILKRHPDLLPKPLDDGIAKMWGFASEYARHVREDREVGREEAQLVLGIAASVAAYLADKFSAR